MRMSQLMEFQAVIVPFNLGALMGACITLAVLIARPALRIAPLDSAIRTHRCIVAKNKLDTLAPNVGNPLPESVNTTSDLSPSHVKGPRRRQEQDDLRPKRASRKNAASK